MTQLLGRQDCIESLRKDLVDVQGAILDVFSRTGPVRFSSWKFPDKLSCNLDMLALLEQYDFVDGEDAFNQHSHIVLLELMIDRLMLLLQSLNAYIEQLRSSHRREESQQRGCLSVGLIVRSYWTNLVQFVNIKENCRGIRQQTKTAKPMSPQMTDLSTPHPSAWTSTGSFKHCPQNQVSSTSPHNTPGYPVVTNYTVSCQTVESSLTPCDACHQVQSILRQTGDALVALFQSEGLPSSLQHLLVAVEDTVELGKMTAGDVAQWANEQLRDMRRLAKHLQDVRGSVQPLKERLIAAETERERFRSQLAQAKKEFKEELEKHQANNVQLEFSLRKAERAMTETNHRLQEEHQRLRREIASLEEMNSKLQEKVALQQDTLQAFESENKVLQEKVKTLQIEEEACCQLRQRIQQLESQTSDTRRLLDKENAKYQSACRQQESMQAKQKSLIERFDTLDEECEELQRLLGEKEEQQNDLHTQLQQMTAERERLQAQLTQQQELCLEAQKKKQIVEVHAQELKKRVAELETHIKSSQERERLLVAFPGLTPVAHAQPQRNVLMDMKQQLQANSIRIEVLTRENATLQRSLDKLKEREGRNTTMEDEPQQAWGTTPSNPFEDEQLNPETPVQKSQLLSSSAARLAYGSRGKQASRGESGLESAGSRDRVSASAPSVQIHLQSLHLNTDSSAAQRNTKKRSTFLISHPRGSNKIKENPGGF